tara:strand:+ start:154 stop:507 length:354 start_codon:yes stop_codon:yes gene_type:complete
MKSHTTVLAIVFGFLIINYFFNSELLLLIIVVISGMSLLSNKFSEWVEILWGFISKILSFIVPNILLSIVFFFLLTPLSVMSKIFKSQSDYKKKNNSDTTFLNRKKNYEKESFERMW